MHPLLFSIDLEEFYPADPAKKFRCTPVERLVDRYLELLQEADARATFFVVGELARKFPDVIARITIAGHEIGSHGDRHIPVDQLGEKAFYVDLMASRRALASAGARNVRGFRAPIFSITSRTPWAHRILADAGFRFSTSVLPAANPLYGWPEFGNVPKSVDGIMEVPITIGRLFSASLPIFGGTYFRITPWWILRNKCRAALRKHAVQSYFHPYDIDAAQERVLHAGLRRQPALNWLLFLNRRNLPGRLRRLLALAETTLTYSEYLAQPHSPCQQ